MKFIIMIISLMLFTACEWQDEKETINDIGDTAEREGKNAADGIKDTVEGVGEMLEREAEPYTD